MVSFLKRRQKIEMKRKSLKSRNSSLYRCILSYASLLENQFEMSEAFRGLFVEDFYTRSSLNANSLSASEIQLVRGLEKILKSSHSTNKKK